MPCVIRKKLRVRDIPDSWNVRLPDDPDAPVTVVITPGDADSRVAPLSSYIGSGRGAYRSPAEVDEYIRRSRDEWEK